MMHPPPGDPRPDAGVVARVRTRTAAAAMAAGSAGAALAALGWWRPGWFAGVAGSVIGACVVALFAGGGAVLAGRVAAWARAARIVRDLEHASAAESVISWTRAAIGDAVPIHRVRPGSPPIRVGRRLHPQVLPLRAATGALAAGRAVILHPRQDGLLPQPGDHARVHEVGHRGPFLIRRDDGMVFVADSWPLSTL